MRDVSLMQVQGKIKVVTLHALEAHGGEEVLFGLLLTLVLYGSMVSFTL